MQRRMYVMCYIKAVIEYNSIGKKNYSKALGRIVGRRRKTGIFTPLYNII